MKALSLLSVCSLLAISTVSGISVNGEFILGFETGIMQRNNDYVFHDFNCEDAEGSNQQIKDFLKIVKQFKTMAPLMAIKAGKTLKDNPMNRLYDSVELFLESIGDLSAVFTNYDGSDYCGGLNFGYSGASLLTNLASTITTVQDMK